MTKEDLEQIRELFVAEREHTKKLLEANNRVLGTIFKVELVESNKWIDAITHDIKALRKGGSPALLLIGKLIAEGDLCFLGDMIP